MQQAQSFPSIFSVAILTCLIVAVTAILIVVIASSSLLRQVRAQVEATKDLELARFDFEKRLAFVRARMERCASIWKHKAEFAERSLSSFYEVDLLLESVRRRQPASSRSFSLYRQAKQSLDQSQELLQELTVKRHTAYALFGPDGAMAYEQVIQLLLDVRAASYALAESEVIDKDVSGDQRAALEAKIWSNPGGDDPIAEKMATILGDAQHIFGAALQGAGDDIPNAVANGKKG